MKKRRRNWTWVHWARHEMDRGYVAWLSVWLVLFIFAAVFISVPLLVRAFHVIKEFWFG